MRSEGLYSQYFNVFVAYEWAQSAVVLHYTRLEKLAEDKHSSLLALLISYEEKEVLWILSLNTEFQGSNPASSGTTGKIRRVGEYHIEANIRCSSFFCQIGLCTSICLLTFLSSVIRSIVIRPIVIRPIVIHVVDCRSILYAQQIIQMCQCY